MQLLNLLILSPHSPSLTSHLAQLDPFPDGEPFQKYRQRQLELHQSTDHQSIEQEIERFLTAGESLAISRRMAGLHKLTEMIRSTRSDVGELLKSGSDSILNLLQVLVGVTPELVTTPNVAMEMGRVLGELGGVDLHCIALPTSPLSRKRK